MDDGLASERSTKTYVKLRGSGPSSSASVAASAGAGALSGVWGFRALSMSFMLIAPVSIRVFHALIQSPGLPELGGGMAALGEHTVQRRCGRGVACARWPSMVVMVAICSDTSAARPDSAALALGPVLPVSPSIRKLESRESRPEHDHRLTEQ